MITWTWLVPAFLGGFGSGMLFLLWLAARIVEDCNEQ